MPTERLYFADPYCADFSARVVTRTRRGDQYVVVLDRTAFYPEGGGQPADHGALDGSPVVDVQADEAGVVWHTVATDPGDGLVQGRIDWGRRFDHMQQHHGQHLLSAAFEDLFGLPTLAFHLGADYTSIDLPGEVPETHLRSAEELTNRIIWEDRPVHARFVSADELAALQLRKLPAVEGPVRVVSVLDFDHSACGGTHPRSTGAVGLLHIRRRERRGAETRVEFVCGGRALRDLREASTILTRLAASLTVGVGELEEAIARLRRQEEQTRKRLAASVERVLAYDAETLAGRADRGVVATVRDDLSLEESRALAREITARGLSAVIGVRGAKAQLVLMRAERASVDCGAVARRVLTTLGGRGGGQPHAAEGGVPDPARLEEAVAHAATELRAALG